MNINKFRPKPFKDKPNPMKVKSKNRYHQGFFKPNHPEKYKGDPTQIFARSSWEISFMLQLDSNPDVIEWGSEVTVLNYISPIDNRQHRYYTDFTYKKKENGKIVNYLIEIKPKAKCSPPKTQKNITKSYIYNVQEWGVNSAKWEAAKAYCLSKGWVFQILNEEHLGIDKKGWGKVI